MHDFACIMTSRGGFDIMTPNETFGKKVRIPFGSNGKNSHLLPSGLEDITTALPGCQWDDQTMNEASIIATFLR